MAGSQGIPTGTVQFFNGNPTSGGIMIASATVNPGTGIATATVSSLGSTSATTAIYAVYIPTPTVFTYAGSTSAPISFGTTTTLSSSSPVAGVGEPVTFTATVTPTSSGAGTPSGSVAFSVDGTVVATVPLNAATGQASFTTSSLAIGTHKIIATFTANAPFQGSTSSTLSQSVGSSGTLPTLTLLPVRNRHGKLARVELVAEVQATTSTIGTPTGSVTYFINGRANYQTVPLTNGIAVFRAAPRRLVNKYVYVRYNGSAGFVGSASSNEYISHRIIAQLATTRARDDMARPFFRSRAGRVRLR